MTELTADLLMRAYAMGVFPMAESRSSQTVQWVDPHHRGIFPLDAFHISRSLRKTLLRADYQVHLNHDFGACVEACADRDETWINDPIAQAYDTLHANGHAHSVEVWHEEQMVGGVYGVTLGAAFFGESMFSRRRDGSKIALAWLVARLRFGGFTLFDTQFLTDHLSSLGAIEITRADYHTRLRSALKGNGRMSALSQDIGADLLFENSSAKLS
ncbi:MAG: leucyl/phenylalanyl-tRNA--protein transferase [Sulfitobacter sp.]|jgi:leucyl/phenylalanyl-tRNA--protein transferase